MTNEMIGVEVDPAKIISQGLVAGGRACVPSSFLNALRFGPPPFQEAFMALPGDTDAEKLEGLVRLLGSSPSEVLRGARLFQNGVQLDDMATYFNTLLASPDDFLTGKHFEIAPDWFLNGPARNEEPPAHLRRIHSLLASSLLKGVPIIASVHAYGAAERQGEGFTWRRLGQHAVLIVRVPSRITPGAQGFVCQFVDPGIGELCEGYVYNETSRPFQAIKSSVPGLVHDDAANKFVPIMGVEDRWIDNGFLHINAPALSLGTQNVRWYARTFLALSHGLGNFGRPKVRNTKGGLWSKTTSPRNSS